MEKREAFFQDLCENAHDLIQSVAPDGRILYVNRAWREALGYAPEEVPGLHITQVIAPESLDHCMAIMGALMSGREVAEIEAKLLTKDGRRVAIEGSARCAFENGAPVSTRGIFRNVTLRNRAEEELEKLFNLSLDLLCVGGADGFFRQVNPTFARLLGYSEEELLGTPFLQFVHPEDRQKTQDELAQLERGTPTVDFENRVLAKDGHSVEIAWRSSPVTEQGLFYTIGRDVTESNRMRALLQKRTQELARSNEELELFAYAASHDLRAPLRGIRNLLDWLEEDLGSVLEDKSRQRIDQMRSRLSRMESLTEDLLQYSRVDRTKHESTQVDVGKLLSDLIALLALPPGMRTEIAGAMPVLRTARTPLEQILRNLLTNAARHHDRPEGVIRVEAVERGQSVEFIVSDDGPGIPETECERVFQMFHKLPGVASQEGSGLGLALVDRIVRRLGGRAWVTANEPRGAAFHFTWPKHVPE